MKKNRLKIVREHKNCKIDKAAGLMGVSVDTYIKYEESGVLLDVKKLSKLAEELNVDARFLAGCDYEIEVNKISEDDSLLEDYRKADKQFNVQLKEYIEYRHCKLRYLNDNNELRRLKFARNGKIVDTTVTLDVAKLIYDMIDGCDILDKDI